MHSNLLEEKNSISFSLISIPYKRLPALLLFTVILSSCTSNTGMKTIDDGLNPILKAFSYLIRPNLSENTDIYSNITNPIGDY